ncbi:MAG: hypothetical protein IPN96_19550 [Anaerolineales bacterium]|nr:hypothetical protein [Anaerolineales bacterium]
MIGFVYFDESLGKNQFFVSRFVVSCCAAEWFCDCNGWRMAASLHDKQDSWVLVKGTIKSITINGQTVPLILAESVQAVPAPEQPYLFP